jgi:hypothetical protein
VGEFLLELYVPRADGIAVERGEARARVVAQQLAREGTPVRFLRSIFLPDDETCFYLFEAATAQAVVELAGRADLAFDRLAEAFTASSSPPRPSRPRPLPPLTDPRPQRDAAVDAAVERAAPPGLGDKAVTRPEMNRQERVIFNVYIAIGTLIVLFLAATGVVRWLGP